MSARPNVDLSDIATYAKDFDYANANIHKSKIEKTNIGSRFKTMLKMISDKEFSLDPRTKLIYVGALAYTVMPLDAIPDYIPVVGLLDDATVLKIVWDSSVGEVKRYLGFVR
jgi:uncharacterized membrane protein YkvA (DUF1232 family)